MSLADRYAMRAAIARVRTADRLSPPGELVAKQAREACRAIGSRSVVYALVDPRSDEVRYIGGTGDGESRARAHVYGLGRAKRATASWLRDLWLWDRLVPRFAVLGSPWTLEREQHWIEVYRSVGAPLLNRAPALRRRPS